MLALREEDAMGFASTQFGGAPTQPTGTGADAVRRSVKVASGTAPRKRSFSGQPLDTPLSDDATMPWDVDMTGMALHKGPDGRPEDESFMPWEVNAPLVRSERIPLAYRRAGEAGRQLIEVPCAGAIPGEERSVQLPDGRECIVHVPSDVTGDRFYVEWTRILPNPKKRRRAADPTTRATKDSKSMWKHVDALIAARPSSTLATLELLRLRAPPRTRVLAPPVAAAEHYPAWDEASTLLSQWSPASSSLVGGEPSDEVLDGPLTSSGLFSAPSSTDLFGMPDFLQC